MSRRELQAMDKKIMADEQADTGWWCDAASRRLGCNGLWIWWSAGPARR